MSRIKYLCYLTIIVALLGIVGCSNSNENTVPATEIDSQESVNQEYGLIDEEIIEQGDIQEQIETTDNALDESIIQEDSEGCSIEDFKNLNAESGKKELIRDPQYGVLQVDGNVRPIYRYIKFGEFQEPEPMDINLSEGEQLITLNPEGYSIQKVRFNKVCPVEVVLKELDDNPASFWGISLSIINSLQAIEDIYLDEYDWFDWNRFTKRLQFEGDDVEIDGKSGEELVNYVKNNSILQDSNDASKRYCLLAGKHTIGCYEGVDYKEYVTSSTLYVPNYLNSEKKYEKEIDFDIERTKEGYFIVKLPDGASGEYTLYGHGDSYCCYINIIR